MDKEKEEKILQSIATVKDLVISLASKIAQSEIKVTVSDKVNNQLLSFGVSKYCKTGDNEIMEMEKLYKDIQESLKTAIDKLQKKQEQPVQRETVQSVAQTVADSFPEMPQQNQETSPVPFCHICGSVKKLIPAGVSKKTNKPYPAFFICPKGCKQEPDAKRYNNYQPYDRR